MEVIGKYWIGNIFINCDCGYEQEYIVPDDVDFVDEGDNNNVWTCPECGKKINIDYYCDDSRDDNIFFEELESEDGNYESNN